MPAQDSPFYRWEDNAGLEHHCGVCQTGLSSPRAINTCIGKHVEPCYRYHQQLHFIQKSHECFACRTADEMHLKRHKEIELQIRELKEHDQSALIKSQMYKRNKLKTRPDDDDCLEVNCCAGSPSPLSNEVIGEHLSISLRKKERKKARKFGNSGVRLGIDLEIVTAENLEFISEAIHLRSVPSKGASLITVDIDNLDSIGINEEEIDGNLSWNRFQRGLGGWSALMKECNVTTGGTPALAAKQKIVCGSHGDDPVSLVDPKIFERLGVDVSHASDFTKKRRDLVNKLASSINADIKVVERDEEETSLRAEGFWRYVNKNTKEKLVAQHAAFSWMTGELVRQKKHINKGNYESDCKMAAQVNEAPEAPFTTQHVATDVDELTNLAPEATNVEGSQLTLEGHEGIIEPFDLTPEVHEPDVEGTSIITTEGPKLAIEVAQLTTEVSELTSDDSSLTTKGHQLNIEGTSIIATESPKLEVEVAQLTTEDSKLTTGGPNLTTNGHKLVVKDTSTIATGYRTLAIKVSQLPTEPSERSIRAREIIMEGYKIMDELHELAIETANLTARRPRLGIEISKPSIKGSQLTSEGPGFLENAERFNGAELSECPKVTTETTTPSAKAGELKSTENKDSEPKATKTNESHPTATSIAALAETLAQYSQPGYKVEWNYERCRLIFHYLTVPVVKADELMIKGYSLVRNTNMSKERYYHLRGARLHNEHVIWENKMKDVTKRITESAPEHKALRAVRFEYFNEKHRFVPKVIMLPELAFLPNQSDTPPTQLPNLRAGQATRGFFDWDTNLEMMCQAGSDTEATASLDEMSAMLQTSPAKLVQNVASALGLDGILDFDVKKEKEKEKEKEDDDDDDEEVETDSADKDGEAEGEGEKTKKKKRKGKRGGKKGKGKGKGKGKK